MTHVVYQREGRTYTNKLKHEVKRHLLGNAEPHLSQVDALAERPGIKKQRHTHCGTVSEIKCQFLPTGENLFIIPKGNRDKLFQITILK